MASTQLCLGSHVGLSQPQHAERLPLHERLALHAALARRVLPAKYPTLMDAMADICGGNHKHAVIACSDALSRLIVQLGGAHALRHALDQCTMTSRSPAVPANAEPETSARTSAMLARPDAEPAGRAAAATDAVTGSAGLALDDPSLHAWTRAAATAGALPEGWTTEGANDGYDGTLEGTANQQATGAPTAGSNQSLMLMLPAKDKDSLAGFVPVLMDNGAAWEVHCSRTLDGAILDSYQPSLSELAPMRSYNSSAIPPCPSSGKSVAGHRPTPSKSIVRWELKRTCTGSLVRTQ